MNLLENLDAIMEILKIFPYLNIRQVFILD